jgi:hypothetical protein
MAISAAASFREMGLGTAGEEAGEGVALVVLGILALARIAPTLLNSVAVLVAGVALVVEGVTLSARYAKTLSRVAPHNLNMAEMSGGMSSSLIGGLVGIVLGILAIIGVASEPLVGVALIVFGASVLLDYTARTQMRALRMAGEAATGEPARIALSAASTTNTAGMLVAVGLVTLGILMLVHLVPNVLASAAFIALGAYLLLEGTALSSWLLESFVTE